jgi:predicted transcriptional regulator
VKTKKRVLLGQIIDVMRSIDEESGLTKNRLIIKVRINGTDLNVILKKLTQVKFIYREENGKKHTHYLTVKGRMWIRTMNRLKRELKL